MERRHLYKSDRIAQNASPRITVINRQTNLPLDRASVRRLVLFFLDDQNLSCDELSIFLVGSRKMSQLHRLFFNDPTVTDCMTFPISSSFLGECVLCPSLALQRNPDDPYGELSHYLIHSLLHLIGHDDIDKKNRRLMRQEERRLLQQARDAQCLLQS